ncbi:hypothetical protein GGR50DRAFT_662114 [Xylaria sp. CBS 124048]|nr:hypothetical protein GGR50DRAFT_662114 [Xylaria sp. CBS 124048]
MAEEVEQLLLAPFRDIVCKGEIAIQNAEEAGGLAPARMVKDARNLVKEGERALTNLVPLSTINYEEYGTNFIDAVKENNDITRFRKELIELLWEFDDYVNIEEFDPDKFDILRKASRNAAPQIWDILKRMKLVAPVSILTSPSPSEAGAPKSARLTGLVNEEVGTDILLWRNSDDTLGPQHHINSFERTSLRHSSNSSSDSPPTPPSANPWHIQRASMMLHPEDGVSCEEQWQVIPDSPTIPLAQLVGPEANQLAQQGLKTNDTAHDEQLVRELSQGQASQASQASERGSWPSPLKPRRWTEFTQSSTEYIPVPPPRSDKRLTHDPAGFRLRTREHELPANMVSAVTTLADRNPLSKGSPALDAFDHDRETSLQGNPGLPQRTTSIIHHDSPPQIHLSPNLSTESVNSSVFDVVESLTSTRPTLPSPRQSINRENSIKITPYRRSGISPSLHPGSLPFRQVSSAPPKRQSGTTVDSKPVGMDEGPMPVHIDISASDTTKKTNRPSPGRAITPSSSFHKLKGFCKGAEAERRGQVGFRRIKRPLGGFATATVAKCVHCMFELDYKSVEEDSNNEASGTRASKTVGYRVRVLQKSHLPARVIDEPVYACVFCIQAGHTLEESDATVFFSQAQLWAHMARHPRPLPKVAGITVIEETELPLEFKDNFDLYFAHPPVPSVMLDIMSEVSKLPSALAIQTKNTAHGTMRLPPDREHALQFAVGARIVGIEFPARYDGKWAVGWHDGVHGAFEADAVRLEAPHKTDGKMPGMSNMTAVARWKWSQKGDERWLKFEKGDVIKNISGVYSDNWWLSGNTAKSSGIFPLSHLDPSSIRPNEGGVISERKNPLKFSFYTKGDGRIRPGLFSSHSNRDV